MSKANPRGIKDELKDVLLHGTADEKIQTWLELTKNEDGHFVSGDWMASLIPYLTLVSTDPNPQCPTATLAFTVQPDHCNRLQNLHGGCAATLFDYCTTLPLALVNQKPGFWQHLGVSRTLNVTYLRPVPVGAEVLIVCEILQIGRKMCTLRGTMKRKSDGVVLALCEHGKFNTDPEPNL